MCEEESLGKGKQYGLRIQNCTKHKKKQSFHAKYMYEKRKVRKKNIASGFST